MNVFFQTKSEMPDVLRRILRLTLQTQNQVVNAGAAVLLPAKFDKAVKMFRLSRLTLRKF